VSESRVRTLLEAIERLAQEADPDVMARIARLHQEIQQRQKELTRLEQGGGVDTVEDELLLEAAENVLHLARELPPTSPGSRNRSKPSSVTWSPTCATPASPSGGRGRSPAAADE
jgi:hypothetical protein